MKNNLAITTLALFLATSTAQAGAKDLRIFDILIQAGAATEQFMSQIHLGLDDVFCVFSEKTEMYSCIMTDIAANEGQGGLLLLSGDNAERMHHLLQNEGMPCHADSIRCTQAVQGVADGSDADRTHCHFLTH
jgi:hypothetical protein